MSTINLAELYQSIKNALNHKVSVGEQALTEEQRAQVRSNLGIVNYGFIDVDSDGVVEMSPYGTGASEPGYLLSESRDSVITAGTAFSVPMHTLNSTRLLVFVGMAKCTRGIEYNDASTTTIVFTEDIPKDYRIEVYSL